MSDATSRWIVPLNPSHSAQVRLLCLPHCGGGTTGFRALAGQMPDEVELCAALLPGRESRRREPVIQEMGPLVEHLVEAVAKSSIPCALLGYCFGAYTAFELARALRGRGVEVAHLFAVAAAAPARVDRSLNIHRLPPEEFLGFLRAQGLMSERMLADPKIFRVFEPAIRADFALIETHPYASGRPLDVPVTVLGARHDVDHADLLDWRHETTAGFGLRLFPGDHAFFAKDIGSVARHIVADLRAEPGDHRSRA